ncbi:hypothetical protein K9M79_07980 [Candidatus Woesearchaeota archaeon]|nr:hypothetical protein [Candidatus Woesearchaeota archaeon]
MGLMSGSKGKELEDTLKTLSTNIEVINQQLSMSSPEFGMVGFQEMFQKNMAAIFQQLNMMNEAMKSSQSNLQQHIDYSLAQFPVLQKQVRQTEEHIKDTVSTGNSAIQSKIAENENRILKEIHANNQLINQVLSQTESINGRIMMQINDVKKGISQAAAMTGYQTADVSKRLGAFSQEVQKEMGTFMDALKKNQKSGDIPDDVAEKLLHMSGKISEKIDKIPSKESTKTKEIPEISLEVSDDIKEIKEQLDFRLTAITSILEKLVGINNKLLTYLKVDKKTHKKHSS